MYSLVSLKKNGLPVDLKGLGDIDSDAEILRFENILRDSVSPRPSWNKNSFNFNRRERSCFSYAHSEKLGISSYGYLCRGCQSFSQEVQPVNTNLMFLN